MSILDETGSFTWGFNCEFFIETAKGNYIWSDPDYGGDHTIRKTDKTYEVWANMANGFYGRCKGVHVIRNYVRYKGEMPKIID